MQNQSDSSKTVTTTSRQVLTWALIGMAWAVLSLIILGFVSDAVIRNGRNENGGMQLWAVIAPVVVVVLLNLPSLVLCFRSLRRADKFDPPIVITSLCLLGLIINVWAIVRALIVFFYVLFLSGNVSDAA